MAEPKKKRDFGASVRARLLTLARQKADLAGFLMPYARRALDRS